MKNRYYVTTPIYYVNDAPHIGHAYTSLACDVMARFKRLDDFDVRFLTGTDEHGQKVEKSAKAAGVDPQTFTDQVSQKFRDLADLMNFSHDDFIRTTEARHLKSAQNFWRRMIESGDIYLGSYAGWYAVRDEAFYSEKELRKNEDGTFLAPTGASVEWVEEPSYFFRLTNWRDRLLEFYDKNPDFIMPTARRNEVISFVKSGLMDLSISRTTFSWGVTIPDDEKHIMYVWLDALINYVTSVGYPDKDSGLYKAFWPADLHMVGKDILRFHTVFWPAFLMSAGIPLPKRVFAHGWWTNEGEKISKSLGNVIDPIELVNTYGLDQVRYFLLREIPFGNDGDFSKKAITTRINSELANDYGNLVQRVLSMIYKNCNATLPAPGPLSKQDQELLDSADRILSAVRASMDVQAFNRALEAIWEVVRQSNSYVNTQAPWKLKKDDPDRMKTVLYTLAEVIRHLAILTQPFMPESSAQIWDQLGISKDERAFSAIEHGEIVQPGTEIPKPEGVFYRYIEDQGMDLLRISSDPS